MEELISIDNVYHLHWIIIFLVICELLNFSERNVFRDFEEIRINLQKGSLTINEMKACIQKGHDHQSFSFNRVIKAYGYVCQLKNLSCLILAYSLLLIVIIKFGYAFESVISIDELAKWLWGIQIALDIALFLMRGRSKIAHILHALHPKYYNTQVLFIIIWLYLIKK